jgi:hypothetical protein
MDYSLAGLAVARLPWFVYVPRLVTILVSLPRAVVFGAVGAAAPVAVLFATVAIAISATVSKNIWAALLGPYSVALEEK